MTPEDGTGIPGADSLVSAEVALELALARGVELDDDEDVLGPLLVQATDWIVAHWTWPRSSRLTSTQGLPWPRYGAYDANGDLLAGVPQPVELAVVLLAIEAVNGALDPNPTEAGVLKEFTEQTGPLMEKRVWLSPQASGRRFPQVERLLQITGGVRAGSMREAVRG